MVGAAIAASLLPSWLGSRVIRTDGGNGYGQGVRHVGQPVTIAYDFQNRTGTELTVAGITLSHPLPPGLRAVRSGMHLVAPGQGYFMIAPRRPEQLLGGRHTLQPVANFHIPPHRHVEYMLEVESTARGRFTIQGVTLHALYPLLVGALPVQVTNMACTQVGVQVAVHFACSG